jgi:hypothetical protein
MAKMEELPKKTIKTCANEPINVDLSDLLSSISQIIRLPMPSKIVVYSQQLPVGTKSFMVGIKDGNMKLSINATIGASNFVELGQSARYTKINLDPNITAPKLYIQSNKDNDLAEIAIWS